MRNSRWLLLLAVVVAGFLMLACGGDETVVNTSAAGSPGITVSGSGRASGAPTVVFLELGSNVEAQTVAAAREAAATAMQGVLNSLKSNGVEERNIQTSQFSVQPQYDFANQTRTLRGYRVQNVVTAKITRIDTAGKIIDDAAAAGGNAVIVQSIRFAIGDPTELQQTARELAVKQAAQRADELARHSGVSRGRLISMSETYQTVVPQNVAVVAAPRTGDISTPVQAGELEVVVNVTLLYAID
jgi:uncharacterized protein YggE